MNDALTENSQNLLINIRRLLVHHALVTRESLIEHQDRPWFKPVQDLPDEIESLLSLGYLLLGDGGFTLTSRGVQEANQLQAIDIDRNMTEALLLRANSPAYGKFCHAIYGINLVQINTISRDAYELIAALLREDAPGRVIDIGCGLGKITEYLATIVDSHFVGLDVALGAISHAQRRKPGQPNVEFRHGDFLYLVDTFTEPFDAILSLDTPFPHYLPELFNNVERILQPTGQLIFGISYSYSGTSPGPPAAADFGQFEPSRFLKEQSFQLKTWNFTPQRRELARRWKIALEELRDEFLDEGNIALYEELRSYNLWKDENTLQLIIQARRSADGQCRGT